MRNKLKSSGGFTMVEMLCAVAILIVLALMLGSGLELALDSYRRITAESESQLLLNTVVDAIANELRCADEISESGGGVTYNGGWKLKINGEGRVVVEHINESGATVETELLPVGKDGGAGGAYHGGTYKVQALTDGGSFITYDTGTNCATVKLKVVWTGGSVTASTPNEGVTIRCLNPTATE